MPKPTYEPAISVSEFVNELVKLHHPHLTNVKIQCVFRDKAKKKNGRALVANVSIVNGLNAWLATAEESRWEMPEPFFVLEVARDEWFKLNETRQRAVVDRYLYRMERDIDTGELVIVPPDIEESTVVVHRHGLYNEDLTNFVKAGAKHLPLLSLIEDRQDLFNMGDTVRVDRASGDTVEISRAELFSAIARLDTEAQTGLDLSPAESHILGKIRMRDGVTATLSYKGQEVALPA